MMVKLLPQYKSTTLIGAVSDTTFQTQFGTLCYIKTSDGGAPTAIGSFKTVSFATTNKPLINPSTSVQFLELTIYGPKNELEALLLEYDLANEFKKIYLEADEVAAD